MWRLGTGRLAGRTVVVAIGYGAHVHVWDAADSTLLLDRTLDDGHGLRLAVAVVGDDTIVIGGPSGLIAVQVSGELVLTEHPRRDLGMR